MRYPVTVGNPRLTAHAPTTCAATGARKHIRKYVEYRSNQKGNSTDRYNIEITAMYLVCIARVADPRGGDHQSREFESRARTGTRARAR
eukprot:COSAG02_NODE_22735_length_741_cov_3.179128_1_plen_88_part_10